MSGGRKVKTLEELFAELKEAIEKALTKGAKYRRAAEHVPKPTVFRFIKSDRDEE